MLDEWAPNGLDGCSPENKDTKEAFYGGHLMLQALGLWLSSLVCIAAPRVTTSLGSWKQKTREQIASKVLVNY